MRSYVAIPTTEIAQLKSSHLKLLIVLLEFADRNGKCWPSLRTIAEAAGSSLAWVQKTLPKMEKDGCLKRRRRGSGSFEYHIAERFLPRREMVDSSSKKVDSRENRSQGRNSPRNPQSYAPRESTREVQKDKNDSFNLKGMIPARRFATPNGGATPEGRKQLRLQKVMRFAIARMNAAERAHAFAGLMADDPQEAQRCFNELDELMKAERWDDAREVAEAFT